MHTRSIRPLLGLNAALLGALAFVTLAPRGDAIARQAGRSPGVYTMVAGRLLGGQESGIYIVDGKNMELLGLSWDQSRKTLNVIGYRDVAADLGRTAARPR